MVGTWILDQYQIIQEIAEGGMGRVYLAEQVAMDRYAAIKILPAQLGTLHETRRRRFQQEARAASRLAHANIVTAYNFGELADGTMFFAMEYIEGKSLAEMLAEGALPLRTAIDIAFQSASALAHAHSGGVVHRDFKPENVMVTPVAGSALHVKVVDFGIAHIIEDATLTRTGELVGTPRYVSPEQCRGEPATPKSDQYAFGLALYEMVKGEPAFYAESTLGYLHCHQHVEAPRLLQGPDEPMPRELSDMVARMLSKSPDERFGAMKDVQHALQRLAARLVDGSAPLGSEIVRRRHVTTPMPAVVAWLGERDPQQDVIDKLSDSGLLLADQYRDPAAAAAAGGTFDAATITLHGDRWREEAEVWGDGALNNVLVVVDGDAEGADLGEMARRFRHLTVGRHPVDPVVLSTSLSWMLRPSKPGVQHLFPNDPIQLVQIRSADQKSSAIDALVDDAKAQGLRRQTRLGLAEVAEELIINALYRAPQPLAEERDSEGTGTGDGALSSPLAALPHGREVTLSWVIDKRFVAVSVRDRFGTLTRERLFSYVAGSQEGIRDVRTTRPSGMGVGLQLVSRVARHVIAALSPDRWCEILVLIDRREAARSGERTLTAITHAGWKSEQLGGGLTLRSFLHGKTRHIQLEGDISELCDLKPVFDWDGDTRVDMSQLRRINSMGIRNWVVAARRRPVGSRLTFERCAVAWVRQLGMLPELSVIGDIISLQVPFFCEECAAERTLVMPKRALSLERPPEARCTACGEAMEFDGSWEAYVSFLAPM